MKSIIVVCEYGWIICGVEASDYSDVSLNLQSASVVRSWRNGKGIGGLAKTENRGEYTLDPIGEVMIQRDKILFTIPCEW